MSRASLIAALSASTLLSACVTPVAYAPPETPATAAGAFVAAPQGLTTPEPPPGEWWRLFNDPAIDALVTEALSNNKELDVAAANLRQVRASLDESRAARTIGTAVNGQAGRTRAPDGTGGFAEDNSASVGFEASYEIDLFGRLSAAVTAAQADADAAEAAMNVVWISVAAETTRAYADACAANAQIAVAQRSLGLLQNSADLTRRQLDAGRGTLLDVSRANAQLESTRSAIPSLLAGRDAALFRLAVLTGRPPAEISTVARDCTAVPTLASPMPVGDGAALLARRPDVRQAERRLAAAAARVNVATASLYPTISLGASASTGEGGGRDFGDLSYSLGPLIRWSFPNVAAARARIAGSTAGADAALASFEQTTLTALQETETALSAYGRELDRLASLRRARDEGATAARIAHMRFDAGADSFLTVLDADRTLTDLEAQVAQSQAQVASSQIAVFRALGGGWEAE